MEFLKRKGRLCLPLLSHFSFSPLFSAPHGPARGTAGRSSPSDPPGSSAVRPDLGWARGAGGEVQQSEGPCWMCGRARARLELLFLSCQASR